MRRYCLCCFLLFPQFPRKKMYSGNCSKVAGGLEERNRLQDQRQLNHPSLQPRKKIARSSSRH